MAMRSSTRRDLFTAGAATALAGIAAVSFAQPETLSAKGGAKRDTHPDARLIADCEAFCVLEGQFLAAFSGPTRIDDDDLRDEALETIKEKQQEFLDRITNSRAKTFDGIRAKARALAFWAKDLPPVEDGYWDEQLQASILRDLTA